MATAPAIEGHAPQSSRIFDIPIDLGRPAELLRRITDWAGSGGPPRKVMYVNAHVLNMSREYPELRSALETADLVYCDGYGVRLAAKALDVEIPSWRDRHNVRPGITGWAQVRQGYVASVEESRIKLSHDLYYLSNCSLRMDAAIVAETLGLRSHRPIL
jgi:hypothetical protein